MILLFSFRFSTELLFCLLLMAFVAAWWRIEETRDYSRVGLLAALATHARPSGLALLPFSLAGLLSEPRARRIGGAAAFLAAFLLVMSPAMARNYVYFGVPSPTPFNGGYTFWLGNHPAMLEGYRAATGLGLVEKQGEAMLEGIVVAREMPGTIRFAPPAQSSYWLRRALDNLNEMGVSNSLELMAWRAWHFVRPWPVRGAHPEPGFWVVTIAELGLFGAGLAGIARKASRDSRRLLPLVVVFGAGVSVHTVFFALMRYRVPFVDLGLILLASGWAAERPSPEAGHGRGAA